MLLEPAKPDSAAGFTAFLLLLLTLLGLFLSHLPCWGEKVSQTKLSPVADGPKLSGWLRPLAPRPQSIVPGLCVES